MKLTKILLATLIALVFTTGANAEDYYKTNVCRIAEASFWDAYKNAYRIEDQSFVESLDVANQRAYFKLAKGKLESSIDEVYKRCTPMDKDLLEAYEKKKSEIQAKLNAL